MGCSAEFPNTTQRAEGRQIEVWREIGPKAVKLRFGGNLISTGIDVIFRKSSNSPEVEMTKGTEHVTKTENGPRNKAYDTLLDKSFMVQPYSVDGAALNPFERCASINITDSLGPDQSPRDTSSVTSLSQTENTEPNKDIIHGKSTTGFPKGGNSYGDGVPIVGSRRIARPGCKVGQRNYSTGPDAAKSGTVILSKLVKLNNGKFTGLYKRLATMILQAYNKIKSNPGTPGVDQATLDGFSQEYVNELVRSLREETFDFKPVRRVFIPKSNGKVRPLGVPSPRDKIVQEGMRALLESIFEPFFLDTNHGFRPNRSCHSALKQTTTWNGYTWCIEGPKAKGFFVDHHILEKLLKRRIEDQQFIDLYWKLVRAGYVEKNVSFDSTLGVPQGGIVSPILSNIYLHELDLFVEKLKAQYTNKGPKAVNLRFGGKLVSKVNPKMVNFSKELRELNSLYQQSGDKEVLRTIRELRMERNKIPSRREATGISISYVRYADDWIIGIIGDKGVAALIKEEIANFLQSELKITLSPDKTKICHFSDDYIKFLGVYLNIPRPSQSKVVLRKSVSGVTRVNHVRMNYLLPKDEIVDRLAKAGFLKEYVPGGPIKVNAITKWIFLDHRSIIIKYNSIIRGLLNYYSFVDNYYDFHLIINFILRHSCAKTLARKFRLGSRAGAFKKYGGRLMTKDAKPIGLNGLDSYAKTKKFKVNLNYSDPMQVLNWKLETHVNQWDPDMWK
uniref:Reverse transcriptase domain-containing protein n=1 Tax=Nitella hyalina TaxID=181804 RepID=H9LTC6_NITHY|nr:hypothetical protein NIHY_p44 [Nitella hyalina]AEH42863.1 hypothetical protein [Nitella hyalina]